MPLRDHFRPPISHRLPWESLHSGLLSELAEQLNGVLPADYIALETVRFGPRLEIDVATLECGEPGGTSNGVAVATQPRVWSPPAPTLSRPVVYPDALEIQIFQEAEDNSRRIVAAIELVSPANKDRPSERQAFVAKVVGYLANGICSLIVDIVTTRRANLHNEIVQLLGYPPETELPPNTQQYAVTYRPTVRDSEPMLDQWHRTFTVGDVLPVMPLRLTGDLFVPVDFETAYTEVCRRRRLT